VIALNVYGKTLERGEKRSHWAIVASYPDGSPIGVWVRAARGAGEGPTLTLLGAQHGDEYSGIEIINRIMDRVDPESLSGNILSAPVSNPLAFNTGYRITPPSIGYENLNMNRVWPGNPKGLLTERIVASLWEELVEGCDTVLDMHEGGKAFMARYIHARGTEETDRVVGEKNKQLYRWFGQGVPVLGGVRTQSYMMGSLSIQTGIRDIPCIGVEVGGGGRLWEDLVSVGVQGVWNIMIGLGMIEDEPVGQNVEQLVASESSWPKTSMGGLFTNTCSLNAIVEKDEKVGELRNPVGELIEEAYAPYRSVIFDTRYQPTVYPGDWTVHCGKIS
jgi:predicted deacylase